MLQVNLTGMPRLSLAFTGASHPLGKTVLDSLFHLGRRSIMRCCCLKMSLIYRLQTTFQAGLLLRFFSDHFQVRSQDPPRVAPRQEEDATGHFQKPLCFPSYVWFYYYCCCYYYYYYYYYYNTHTHTRTHTHTHTPRSLWPAAVTVRELLQSSLPSLRNHRLTPRHQRSVTTEELSTAVIKTRCSVSLKAHTLLS